MVKIIRRSRGAQTKRNRKQYRLWHTKSVRRCMNGGQGPVPCPVTNNYPYCSDEAIQHGWWGRCGNHLCTGNIAHNTAQWVEAANDNDPRVINARNIRNRDPSSSFLV